MDFEVSYIHGGARVNVWRETNFWVILGASITDINQWEVFVNGERNTTGAGYTIVTIYFSANKK